MGTCVCTFLRGGEGPTATTMVEITTRRTARIATGGRNAAPPVVEGRPIAAVASVELGLSREDLAEVLQNAAAAGVVPPRPMQVAQDLPAGVDGQLDAHLLQLREQVRGYIEQVAQDMGAPGPVTVAFPAPPAARSAAGGLRSIYVAMSFLAKRPTRRAGGGGIGIGRL